VKAEKTSGGENADQAGQRPGLSRWQSPGGTSATPFCSVLATAGSALYSGAKVREVFAFRKRCRPSVTRGIRQKGGLDQKARSRTKRGRTQSVMLRVPRVQVKGQRRKAPPGK